MANALVLETLSLKELGALGSSVRLKYWQHLRKGDLLERLAALNRVFTQEDLDAASVSLARKQAARAARVKGLQGVSSDLSSASSDALIPVQNVDLNEASDATFQRQVSNSAKTERSTSPESESAAASELNASSKSKKSARRFETSESANSRTMQDSLLAVSSERREKSALEGGSAETCRAASNAEKVARIAEQVVPALAERLAKRLAECLTKELALDGVLAVQDVVPSGTQDEKKSASGSKESRNEPNVGDVATKLIEQIIPSFPSSPDAVERQEGASRSSGVAENAQTQENAVQDESKVQNVLNDANRTAKKTDEESDDDALIETILPEVHASQRPPRRPADGAPSLKEKLRLKKFIGSPGDKNDRLLLMVCDPYWIRACWEVTSQLVERVRSAMSRHWHTAEPVLRLYQIDPATSRREFVRDVEINGGVSNWYVPVENPPSTFMVELGYKSRDGQFFTLLSSNAVQTPKQFVHDSDGRPCTESFNAPFNFQTSSRDRWVQKSRQTQAKRRSGFDESPKKPFAPSESAVGTSLSNNDSFIAPSTFLFQADAEVLFTGRVSNGATVKVREEPVCQAPDGSFSIRFSLPERRHVFPIVATSLDENETQTIIVAIERNTKTLDPVYKEDNEE